LWESVSLNDVVKANMAIEVSGKINKKMTENLNKNKGV